MEPSDISVGVIGIGHIGTAHAALIYKGEVPGLRLAAVCDVDPARLSYAESELPGAAVFDDWRKIINSGEVDAVIVATPHPLHAEISACSLQAGLHVLTEKPQDIRLSSAQRANQAADGSGCVYAIMFNQRTNPLFIRLRELVRSGTLGRIKSSSWIVTNWYRTQHYYDEGGWRATWSGEGGGVLMNQAVHNLDIWQWICGMPSRITAFCGIGRYHDIEVEDSAVIYSEYPDGSTGCLITSTGECPGTNRLEICGSMGKAVIEGGVLRLWLLPCDEELLRKNAKTAWVDPKLSYSEYSPEDGGPAHRGVLEAFAGAILNGTPLVADGREGVCELEIANAAYMSSWLGGVPVSLPIDSEKYDSLLSSMQSGSAELGSRGRNITGEYSKRWSVKW